MRSYKHKLSWIAFTVLLLSGVLHFTMLSEASHIVSFRVPEKFIYDLTWAGIKAGTASLESLDEGDKVRIVSTARSADWVSMFYTVDDRIESTLSKNTKSAVGQPLRYRLRIREGRHRRDKEVLFSAGADRATYIDHLKNQRKEYPLPGLAFDPISSFFYVRLAKLVVGEPVFVTIFDSKKVWNVEVQVLRKERVSLQIGTFDTVVIRPVLKSEGIFFRKGDILIWLTDDMRRIPVKLQTKVAVGNITATLVRGRY
ncbi:MAG: DUF3108 domain-containing protein [Nitrospirota bacterium]